jgi:transposase-like protein
MKEVSRKKVKCPMCKKWREVSHRAAINIERKKAEGYVTLCQSCARKKVYDAKIGPKLTARKVRKVALKYNGAVSKMARVLDVDVGTLNKWLMNNPGAIKYERKPDCVEYRECLTKAALENTQFQCQGCRRYRSKGDIAAGFIQRVYG